MKQIKTSMFLFFLALFCIGGNFLDLATIVGLNILGVYIIERRHDHV